MKNPLDFHPERLATTDEHGDRVYLYPSEVRGRFRVWRTRVYLFLIFIFLLVPWTTINGVQTILLDIPNRRFSFFGYTFWAHDAPLVFFLLAGIAFSLAAMAAVGGRVWCGWMCPQTVFIDMVFRRIETWIEGNAVQRRMADAQPMTFPRLVKRLLKWFAYAFATLIMTNSFLAYFVGAERMIQMVQRPPQENILAFVVCAVVFGILLFDFGWFREQFCIIMCPYGRLQGVLMDSHSLSVVYDEKRGEPRKSKTVGATPTPFGDCVDCYRCVAVCPTGIDIRRGQQLECIGCTACIDACDEIMEKVKKPKGLIRYDFLSRMQGRKYRWLRPSTVLYASILFVLLGGLVYRLHNYEPLSIEVLRAKGVPYQSGGEGVIVNRFTLEVNNSNFDSVQLHFPATAENGSAARIVSAINPVQVPAGKTSRLDFFVQFPKSEASGGHLSVKIAVAVQLKDREQIFIRELPLVAPL